MKRPWQVWIAFAGAAAVMLCALVWISAVVLRLDREGAEARRTAAFEETVRLALWRMEAVAAPVVAREGARPYFAWQPFYPAGRAYTRMFARLESGDVLVASPLLADPGEYVALHFQLGPDGRLTSPQVPEGNMRDIAESGYLAHDLVEARTRMLARVDADSLQLQRQRLPVVVRGQSSNGKASPSAAPAGKRVLPVTNAAGPSEAVQKQLNANESIARLRAVRQAAGVSQAVTPAPAGEEEVVLGTMRPAWLGDELVLLRRVVVADAEYLQGCLLVWPDLSEAMIEAVRDILPAARLEAVQAEPAAPGARTSDVSSPSGEVLGTDSGPAAGDPRRLAALPVRLDPGPVPAIGTDEGSTAFLTLAVAWGALLAALLAAALLLASAVSLGERRDAFVSAVTHELRTPLTTFRMYTEMLDEGMVVGEEQRRSYLGMLRAEAERLGHLVENVLAYSRLERHRAQDRIEALELAGLSEALLPRLAARAAEAGLDLRIEIDEARPARVRADRDAVERILFNLVDNACKYASHGTVRTLHLAVSGAVVALSDHGPGIPRDTVGRLFRPFSRGARDAAGGPPGIGLGLALSRKLARRMGGELAVGRNGPDGAEFVLTLPRVQE